MPGLRWCNADSAGPYTQAVTTTDTIHQHFGCNVEVFLVVEISIREISQVEIAEEAHLSLARLKSSTVKTLFTKTSSSLVA